MAVLSRKSTILTDISIALIDLTSCSRACVARTEKAFILKIFATVNPIAQTILMNYAATTLAAPILLARRTFAKISLGVIIAQVRAVMDFASLNGTVAKMAQNVGNFGFWPFRRIFWRFRSFMMLLGCRMGPRTSNTWLKH